MNCTIFGPVHSRRFGKSLGIDLSPDQKSCNFDCLYCELPKAKKTETIINPPSVAHIINELHVTLSKKLIFDVITLTANGEPTLYPFLGELIDALRHDFPTKKLLILSNGSTIAKKEVQEALVKLDSVKLSLDCAQEGCFNKIDRPLTHDLEGMIKGMIDFRQKFRGELYIEILLVKGVNDTKENQHALYDVMQKILPDRIDIGTIDRPPAYDVSPLTQSELLEFASFFTGFNVFVPTRENHQESLTSLNVDELEHTISRRPLGVTEASHIYDRSTNETLLKLLKEQKLFIRTIGGVEFYCHHKKG